MERIILASKSPRRRQLLEWAEIPFDVMVKDTDEMYPAFLPIEDVPVYIAKNKALAVKAELSHDRLILAADTIVVFQGKILGKPNSETDARRMLSTLSGNTHKVYTGLVILDTSNNKLFKSFEVTSVKFRKLSAKEISFYVKSGSPMDKAGAYGIQDDFGSTFVEKINGDYFNVVGLPVFKLYNALTDFLKLIN
jgi:septum formation protein